MNTDKDKKMPKENKPEKLDPKKSKEETATSKIAEKNKSHKKGCC